MRSLQDAFGDGFVRLLSADTGIRNKKGVFENSISNQPSNSMASSIPANFGVCPQCFRQTDVQRQFFVPFDFQECSNLQNYRSCKYQSGWWFGTFFMFPYIGNNHPN